MTSDYELQILIEELTVRIRTLEDSLEKQDDEIRDLKSRVYMLEPDRDE